MIHCDSHRLFWLAYSTESILGNRGINLELQNQPWNQPELLESYGIIGIPFGIRRNKGIARNRWQNQRNQRIQRSESRNQLELRGDSESRRS